MIANNELMELMAEASAGAHEGKEGYFVMADGSIPDAVTDVPYGLIVSPDSPDGNSTIALPGLAKIVWVKLTGTPGSVVKGSKLAIHSDGAAKLDPGTGDRVLVGVALEAGAADALIRARIIEPVSVAAA